MNLDCVPIPEDDTVGDLLGRSPSRPQLNLRRQKPPCFGGACESGSALPVSSGAWSNGVEQEFRFGDLTRRTDLVMP